MPSRADSFLAGTVDLKPLSDRLGEQYCVAGDFLGDQRLRI